MKNEPTVCEKDEGLNEKFRKIAQQTSKIVGCAWSFMGALAVILVWGILGPIFHFSDTWQLVINTATTIVTFLMVFLIQNTQNRDSKAIHLKLDELIHAMKGARNQLVSLENMSDEELGKLQKEFDRLARISASKNGANAPGSRREALVQ
jgi:low affinity Fe/Cu permease